MVTDLLFMHTYICRKSTNNLFIVEKMEDKNLKRGKFLNYNETCDKITY